MGTEHSIDSSRLGFGLMRLPRSGVRTDIKQVKQMVDRYMAAGFSYFDTAYVYPGSEKAIRKALVDRYPRESFTLATKINAFLMAPTEKACKQQFDKSLERTGASYFDYYMLHALMSGNYRKYDKYHIWDYVAELKEKGLVKNVGFSFHASPEILEEILTEHPEVDFVQLQINWADWENEKVASRENYEIARRHGKQIIVMEPIKGGKLANPPKEVKRLMDECSPGMSYASWAIRFAASLDDVISVLSGMSNTEQMDDNLSYMREFQPLNADERAVIQQAQRIMGASKTIPCTTCGYCLEGCPKEIAIPSIFTAMNEKIGNGLTEQAKASYASVTAGKALASDCIACSKCEAACPQQLPIIDLLKKCTSELE